MNANPNPKGTKTMKTTETCEMVACPRCGGEKRILTFSYVMGGICFKCHGVGKVTAEAAEKYEAWKRWKLSKVAADVAHAEMEHAYAKAIYDAE